jgi:asparagine synthase (glutamine-hydrolysing)
MCGITGFFSFATGRSPAENQHIISAMADALQTRGPDDSGFWQDPNVPLSLGHRRLSIIDLSPLGHQPMLSHDERYVLSYNGEIYNFQILRQELENLGQRFRGTSDTEVFLGTVSAWGLEAALEKIEGMFAIALWDRQARKLHLIRDRFGEKPLYYGWAGQDFAFASELKAFDQCPDFKGVIRSDAALMLVRYACIPAPYSIFEKIWKLPPANILTLDFSALSPGEDLSALVKPYWSAEKAFNAGKTRLSPQETLDRLDTLLRTAVKTRMISDAPLGAFLSGGIDSSLIVAMMQAQSASKVKTYSVGFEEKPYDEAPFARAIAQHLGTEHTELYVSQSDIQAIIPDMAHIYDEPYANPSQLPTCILTRFAGQHVRVALSGDGGDELFGGYHQHNLLNRIWPSLSLIPHPLRYAAGSALSAIPKAALTRLHRDYGYRLFKRFRTAGKLLKGHDLLDAHRNMISMIDDPKRFFHSAHEPYLAAWDRASRDMNAGNLQTLLSSDLMFYLPHDVLTKIDRAAMAYSLEVRAPFLDRDILSLAGGLSDAQRLQGQTGKVILHQLLARYLPPAMFTRKKAGFNVPIANWLRGPLREWGFDLLNSGISENDPVLDRKNILKIWDGLQKGNKESARGLWAVLMFEQWRQARKSGQ